MRKHASDAPSEALESYPLVFRALSDSTRLRIVRLLAVKSREACVCELVDALGERQYNVSRHLKVLENAGLLRGTKDGRWTYYAPVSRKDPVVGGLFRFVARLPEDDVFRADDERFEERLCLRTSGRCRVGIQNPDLES